MVSVTLVGATQSGGIASHIRGLSSALSPFVNVSVVGTRSHRCEWGQELVGTLLHDSFDLLHLHDPRIASVNRIVRKPLVTTFHGYLDREAVANGASARAARLYSALVRRAVRDSDAIITVDHRIARWLWNDYGGSNIHTIPNGVDTEMFSPRPKVGHWPVAFVAKAPMPKNGVGVAIDAIRLIREEVPEMGMALGYGKIPHEEMPNAINDSDYILIPSVPVAGVEEATSILALEAMACGKPVVASDIGGLKEIIHSGKTGLLVPPNDPHALAQAVLQLHRNPWMRDALGRAARAYVLAEHTWTRVARETVKVYEEVLG